MIKKTSDNIIQSAVNYYEARASWHDSYMNYTGCEALVNLLKPLVTKVQSIISGRSVLEIACGTGNWTQVLAHCAARVLATDASPAMLDIARKKLASLNNVQFQQADAFVLDNISGSFTAAFAIDWWSHIPKSKIELFLETLHRKLEPGSPLLMGAVYTWLFLEGGLSVRPMNRCFSESGGLKVRPPRANTKCTD